MKKSLILVVAISAASSSSQAALVWVGAAGGHGGDDVSLFQELNWEDTGTGSPPADGAIDPSVDVNNDLVVDSGTPGGASGPAPHLQLGSGSLTVNGGVVRMAEGSSAGIRNGVISVNDGELLSQFFANGAAVTLAGGTTTLYGGNNPVNASTVNFTSTDALLNFLNETPAAFESEHLGKITVNGFPAVVVVNLQVDPFNGALGAQVRATSLEFTPATLTWIGAGDGVSFADEANWTGTASTGGTILLDNLVDNYVISDPSATVGGGGGVGRMTITAGSLLLEAGTLTANAQGLEGGGVTVMGGELQRQFFLDSQVTLGGDGTITLNGGGNPVNNSSINIISTTSLLNFNDETPTDFQNEHLGKILVNGDPAVLDWNLQVDPFNGAAGAQVRALTAPARATLTWIGAGDGVSFADEANWMGTASTGGTIDLDNLVDNYVINDPSATVGGGGGVGRMTIKGGSLLLEAGTLSANTQGLEGGGVTVMGGDLQRQFFLDSEVTLGGDGIITLNGGGNPVNNSSIESSVRRLC